ncbi:MAG: tryptophan synthase subunit alpha [Ignavibacteriae bacterium]|nr:tryptophan synthase subunit alpha [Ignavibacteriota bacterium]
MNRITQKFQELSKARKKAIIPYITPDYPIAGVTLPILQALERSGADLIEVGIPFSDPLADGKTIQHSSEIALRHGATIPKILDDVRRFRASSSLPLLLMGYMNPILRYGTEKFLQDSASAGVDGVIIPDLPPEESASFVSESNAAGLSNVFLIAPTTSSERVRKIDQLSTDFSYCVSVTGVTGARRELGINGSLDAFLKRVRENTKKSFVVGFGISNAEQVNRVSALADGVVVGSALLQAIGEARTAEESVSKAEKFLHSLRKQ